MSDTVATPTLDARLVEDSAKRIVEALSSVWSGLDETASAFDKVKAHGEGMGKIGDVFKAVAGVLNPAVESMADKANKLGETLKGFGGQMTASVTQPLIAIGTAATTAAVDADEAARKMNSAFGSAAGGMNAWLEGLRGTIPATTAELQNFAASFQNLLVPLGIAPSEAERMTEKMLTLGGNLAALNNVPVAAAMDALRGGIQGNFGPLTELGIHLDANALKTEAMRMGLIGQKDELNATAGAQAAYSLIMAQSAASEGEAALHADSAANSFRFFWTAVSELSATIGAQLLPAVTQVVQWLTEMVQWVGTLNPQIIQWGIAFATVAAVIGPMAVGLGGLAVGVGAVATALGIGLMPLILAGGPVLLGLLALGTLFVKAGLEAGAAASNVEAAAARMKNAIAGLGTDQFNRNRITSRHNLGVYDTAIMTQMDHINRQRGIVDRLGPGRRRVEEMDRLGAMETNLDNFRAEREKLDGIVDAYDADAERRSRVVRPAWTPPKTTTACPRATAATAATVDNGNAALAAALAMRAEDELLRRELLATFGEKVPDYGQRAVDGFLQARDKVRDLGAELKKLGSEAPAQGFALLNALNEDLKKSRATLKAAQDQYKNPAQEQVASPSEPTYMESTGPGHGVTGLGNLSPFEQFVFDLDDDLKAAGEVVKRYSASLGPAFLALGAVMQASVAVFGLLRPAVEKAAGALAEFAGPAVEKLKGWASDALGSLAGGGSRVGNAISGSPIGGALSSVLGPVTGALGGLAGAAAGLLPLFLSAQVLGPMFEAIKPALDALMVPLQMVAEIFGAALAPILEALFPIFKMLAIAATYVGEIFYRISAAIMKAIGGLIKGLGSLIDRIPGMSDLGLKGAGQALINLGKGYSESAEAMAEGREKIRNLDWEDALEGASNGADKMEAALTDIPKAINLALYRGRVGAGAGGGAAPPSTFVPPTTPEPGGGVVVQGPLFGNVVNEAGDTPATLARKMEEAARYMRSTGSNLMLPGALVTT